jgi:hypothetical protein
MAGLVWEKETTVLLCYELNVDSHNLKLNVDSHDLKNGWPRLGPRLGKRNNSAALR